MDTNAILGPVATLALWSVSLIGIFVGATLLARVPKAWIHRAAAALLDQGNCQFDQTLATCIEVGLRPCHSSFLPGAFRRRGSI